MLEGLDTIDWRRFRHSYGIATDVPDLIRGLLTEDDDQREQAYEEFVNTINHQGDVYSAATQAVPFLIELLTEDSVPAKYWLLQTLIGLVESSNGHVRYTANVGDLRDFVDTYRNVCAGVDVYLKLLRHPDGNVRRAAACLLGLLTDQQQRIRLKLWKTLENEQDTPTLAVMLENLGKLMPRRYPDARRPIRQKYAAIFERLSASHPERLIRLAAASAWVEMRIPGLEFDTFRTPKDVPAHIPTVLAEALVQPLTPRPPYEFGASGEYLLLNQLATLGLDVLAKTLSTPGIDAVNTHRIARQMLDKAFERRSPQPAVMRGHSSYGSWVNYEDYSRNKRGKDRMYQFPFSNRYFNPERSLNVPQKSVLATIVDNDLFWELPTNLFSFFYGLPDSRDDLRKLLAANTLKSNEGGG